MFRRARLSDSLALSALFRAVGAGAVLQVAVMLRADRSPPTVAFGGVMAGMLALYATGLLIK